MNKSKFLYIKVKHEIKKLIKEHNLVAGDLIPSEAKLMQKFDVSRVTIRMAIDKLVEENILYKKKGSGTYIKKLDHSKLVGLTEEMELNNKKIENDILDFKIISSPKEISEILEIKEDEKVYYITRLRKIDEKSIMLENSYMPLELFKDLSINILSNSKYEYIEKKYNIKQSSQKILPILPTEEIAKILNIDSSKPILQVNSIGILDNLKPFEYTIHYYNPEEYPYRIIATR